MNLVVVYDTEGNYTDKNGVFTPKEKLNGEGNVADCFDSTVIMLNQLLWLHSATPNVQSITK
jgi:hypothetical protein